MLAIALLGLMPVLGLLIELVAPRSDGGMQETFQWLFSERMLAMAASSLGLTLVVTALALPLGILFAWVEQRAEQRLLRGLASLCILPLCMPSFLAAMTLRRELSAGGWLNFLTGSSSVDGFLLAALVLVVVCVPYVQLVVSASLARSSGSEEDACRLLGGTWWQHVRIVVWPRVKASVAGAALIVGLYVLSDFGVVDVMNVPVLTREVYGAAQAMRMDQGVASSLVLALLALPMIVLALRMRRVRQVNVANPRPGLRRMLPPVAVIAVMALQITVIGLGVVVPVISMGGWVANGIQLELEFQSPVPALLGTLELSLYGGVLVVALSLLPAWRATQRPTQLSRLVEGSIFAGSAVPGIMVAFGLLLATLGLTRALSGDYARDVYAFLTRLPILVGFAYAIRFFAEGYASVRTGFEHLDRRQLDAAALLEPRRWRRSALVALPAVAPGITVALLLVMINVCKELPITLLLGGMLDRETLSRTIYNTYSEVILHRTGLHGLVLCSLSFVIVLATLRWRRHA